MKGATPKGYNSVSPYLVVDDVDKELEFIETVFAAEIREQQRNAEGKVSHGEARLGESIIMVRRASKELPAAAGSLHVWVEDVEATFRSALEHGAESVFAPQDRAYGNREAGIRDPQGNIWWIANAVRKLSSREIERKLAAQRRERL